MAKPSHLKKALQSFYKREKNRLVFSNNLSLNQLAIEMWERLNYSEIDASVISRVIHGERLFSPKQLAVFCDIINASEKQRIQLKSALWRDCYIKHSIDIDLLSSSYSTDLAEANIEVVHKTRISGHPDLALELADIILSKFTNAFSNLNELKSSFIVNRLLPELLQEKSYCYFETSHPNQIVDRVRPIAEKMKFLAKGADNKDAFGTALFHISDAYYVAEKFRISYAYSKQSLTFLVNRVKRVKCHRNMALNLAYLGEKEGVEKIEAKLENEIVGVEPIMTIDTLEGLGRAQGIMRLHKAFNTLEKAKQIYKSSEKEKQAHCFQEIQLLRSSLEVMSWLSPKNKQYMQKIGEKGLSIASLHGYKRHANKIKNLIYGTLN